MTFSRNADEAHNVGVGMHWFREPIRVAVEQLVTAYQGHPWRVKTAKDMQEFASHPCAILADDAYRVFVKLSTAANGADQVLAPLGFQKAATGVGIEIAQCGFQLLALDHVARVDVVQPAHALGPAGAGVEHRVATAQRARVDAHIRPGAMVVGDDLERERGQGLMSPGVGRDVSGRGQVVDHRIQQRLDQLGLAVGIDVHLFGKGRKGGAAQGIGWALNEEYIYGADGRLQNAGFLDYRIPVASDLPMIDAVIVEVPNPAHPYGVRGVGETPICPPLAAIANAVSRATGHRFTSLPMSPPKVLAALDAAKKG